MKISVLVVTDNVSWEVLEAVGIANAWTDVNVSGVIYELAKKNDVKNIDWSKNIGDAEAKDIVIEWCTVEIKEVEIAL